MTNYQKVFERVLENELPPKRVKAVAAELQALIGHEPVPAPKPVAVTPHEALRIVAKALNEGATVVAKKPLAAAPKAKAKTKAAPKAKQAKAAPKVRAKRPNGKRGLPAETRSAMASKKELYWALFRKARGDVAKPDDAQRIKSAEPELVKAYKAKIQDRLGTDVKAAPKAKKTSAKPKAKNKPKAVPAPASAVETEVEGEAAPVQLPVAANGAASPPQQLSEEQRKALNL